MPPVASECPRSTWNTPAGCVRLGHPTRSARNNAAEAIEFERAAALRDRIRQMSEQLGKRLDEAELYHATRTQRGKHRKRHEQSGGTVPKPGRGNK
jgi:hypothetical protein